MSLQEQIAVAITSAFEELGGDANQAVEAARHHSRVDDWVQQETAKIAVAGGVEMAIPGIHALTIPAGITFLLHKMATISWGIGAIKGAYIVETSQYSDLRNILTLWANSSYYTPHIMDYVAIKMDLFTHVCTPEGYATLEKAIANADADQTDNVIVNTLHVLKTLADQLAEDERSQEMVRYIAPADAAEAAISAVAGRMPSEYVREVYTPMGRRISTRLAAKVATRIGARVPARFLMGFIPLAGPIVNAFFNAQTLMDMAETAKKYYDHPFTIKQLEELV
ncbi:MAG: hypothetical protein CL607_09305 [Anaerolineaceae bacterium]|nr:hypothetical protein [Anaerolineaceae bacterium]